MLRPILNTIVGIAVVVSLSIASETIAADAAPTVVECRWTDEPIVIDGRDDEAAWRSAAVIDDFRVPGPAGGKPKTATKAKLLWDREYLYFFAEMEDHDLFADITEHNGRLWMNDVFELFLKPADDKPGYYEFEVNPAGATLELYFPSRDSGGYERFKDKTKIQLKAAVKLRGTLNRHDGKGEGWSVEGRIRWRDFAPTAGRPNIDEVWKFAFCRGDITIGSPGKEPGKQARNELSSNAPLTKPSFHEYEDYVPLRFVGPDAMNSAAAARRPRWTNSHVIGSPDPPPPFVIARVFPKLKVKQPLYLLEEPGTKKLLLLHHLGDGSGPSELLRFESDANVDSAETLLHLDWLIYGMALHPDFVHNGYLYLISNGPVDAANKQNRISRFTIDRKSHAIDPKSELVILEWESNGHNGGDLAFGPDGFLYHAAGDGTSDSDTNLRGQDITHLTSAMIRIDVDHPADGKPYSVPKDNPFLDSPGARPEIWAYGFRNPWRLAFDRVTGALWVGQNGQDTWEQVYRVRKGENYGWSIYEGSHPFYLNRKRGPTPITFPTVEHPHSEMRSVTGGVVYRGDKLPELRGAFIYGDYSTGRIWGVKHDGQKVTWHKELARTTLQITGFRETTAGDLLVIDHGGGFYRLDQAPLAADTPPFPKTLSATGLFLSTRDNRPDPALIPYDVNAPLWSDGAAKERFIALPGDGTISAVPLHGWDFPEGTVLVKTFSLDMTAGDSASCQRIETRLLTKQLGQWVGYSYRWADDQSDAALVGAAGEDVPLAIADPAAPGGKRTQTWHYPSRTECMVCHTRASNFVLGLTVPQLNRGLSPFAAGTIAAMVAEQKGTVPLAPPKQNQLEYLERLGILQFNYVDYAREALAHHWPLESHDSLPSSASSDPQREVQPSSLLPFDPKHLPRLADPYDAMADLDLRARSYLHANCAICHVESGGGNAQMNLEYDARPADCKLFDERPQHEAFGLPNARLVAAGHPESSILLHRLTIRGQGQMPPLATSRVDERAVEMLATWIAEMGHQRGPRNQEPSAHDSSRVKQ